jgi:hypothetical protein
MIATMLRVTAPCPDGSAIIAAHDLTLLLSALRDAVGRRGACIGRCRACRPGQICAGHKETADLLDGYLSLSRCLGAGR